MVEVMLAKASTHAENHLNFESSLIFLDAAKATRLELFGEEVSEIFRQRLKNIYSLLRHPQ